MFRKWLAIVGILLIVGSSAIGLAWAQYWKATRELEPELEEMGLWRFLQSIVEVTPERAIILTLIGLLLGIALTVPWWRKRLESESVWWEKRDEPLDTPPRVPGGGI